MKEETKLNISLQDILKNLKNLWSLFMDGVQLPQGYSHFEEAVYFFILLTSDGWKAKLTLEPPSGFEHGEKS